MKVIVKDSKYLTSGSLTAKYLIYSRPMFLTILSKR